MAYKHFFKPLLPDFHNHLTIPVAFFSKYIQGRNEQKMAKLRSDASKITWEVKVEDGRKLTDGWKEFALSHDLRIGDILIFRQENTMAFHVTLLGPSCCEIQYESFLEDHNNLQKYQRKKKVKKNLREETESSSLDPSCFVANVSPATLRYDSLEFCPRSFVRANGLGRRCGEIVLMNEEGFSWTLALKRKQSCGTMYITRGWRSFCHANGLRAGDFFTFKLLQRGKTLVLRLSLKESNKEEDCSSEGDEIESISIESDSDEEEINQDEISCKNSRSTWKVSSSPYQNRSVTLTLKPYNVERSILNLPVPFTRVNGINDETKMTLLDKHGVKWSTDLRSENRDDRIRMVGGWKEFFKANCVKIGELIMLKLIWEGDKSCVLKFCYKVKPETN